MPEPLTNRPQSDAPESRLRPRPSIPGLSDGLGDRSVSFESGSEGCIETRRFEAGLGNSAGFEPALRAQVERLGAIRHPALTTIRAVERRDNALFLISRVPSGRRLFELVEEENGWAFALKVVREVLPALVALYRAGAGAHGAISAPRIQLTREGRLVLVEHVLAPALESLNLSREAFRALGIVVPDGVDAVRFTEQTDLAQLGYVALSLLLGRSLNAADFPTRVPAFLDEFADGMGSPVAAAKVRGWLERVMQVRGAQQFASATDAQRALEELSADASVQVAESEGALLAFASESQLEEPVEMVATVPVKTKSSVAVIHPPRLTNTVPAPVPVPIRVAVPIPAPIPAPVAVAVAVADAKPVVVATPRPTKTRGVIRVTTWMIAALGAIVLVEMSVIGGLLYWKPAGDVDSRRPGDRVADVPPQSGGLTVGALAPRQPAGASASTVTPAPTPTTAPAPKPGLPTAAAPRVGGLTVASAIELIVLEHGAPIGSTSAPLAVTNGRHTLDFVNQTFGFRLALPVSITGGRMTTLKVPLPNGRVSINADPWARVAIDGADVGSTPLANLAVPIGTHEVLFAHPQFGERRQTVVVKVDGISRVTQNFR